MYENVERPTLPTASGIRCALLGAPGGRAAEPRIAGLVDLIVTRYHEVHRREFPEAIRLARKVEAAHAGHRLCPKGLADHLAFMFDDLESHQHREEEVLFPMMLGGGNSMMRFPIARMMAEHVDVLEQIAVLRGLTDDYALPPDACATWGALVAACRKIDIDLNEHMRLENEVLFPAFLP